MSTDEYRLLDCGDGRKLEAFGPHLLDRPVNYAVWRRAGVPAWAEAPGVYHRSDKGGGEWEWRRELPESWDIRYAGLPFRIKPTPFGHVGLFAEQRGNWDWMRELLAGTGDPGEREVLNLFAYTGGSTLACAQAGARVTHVDASKGAVNWARENAALGGLEERPVRWVVEDVLKYVRRELKRGRRYDGIVMDPPSYGRGAKGQVFKIEEDLPELVEACWELTRGRPLFFVLSCHSASFTPRVLAQVLERGGPGGGVLEAEEMVIPGAEGGPELPSGVVARWRAA